MGFRMKITGGAEEVVFDERSITKVDFQSASSADSNARATDFGLTVKVWGKMLYKLGGEGSDPTLGLAQWSQVPSERADCYRKVTVEHIAAGIMERRYSFPNAFVIDYKEDFGDVEGTGTFTLVIKQKKDKLDKITIEGGYSAG